MFHQPMLLQFQEMLVVRSRSQAVLQSGFFHHPRGIYFNLSRECHGNLKCVNMMVWKKEKRSFQLRLFNDIYHLKSQKCRWWFQPHLASSFLEPKITNMLEVKPPFTCYKHPSFASLRVVYTVSLWKKNNLYNYLS